MAVDVSKIPNNSKFDPVREAILDLQSEIEDTGGSIGNGTLTVSTSGTLTGSGAFTANQSSNTTITIGIDDSTYLTSADLSDYLLLTDTGEQTIAGDIVISGDLTVSGTTTYINTTHLNIGDNIITLNADLPSDTAPSENAGIEINRGSSTDVDFLWNEADDRWDLQARTGLRVYRGGIGSTTLTIEAGSTAGDAIIALTPNTTGLGGIIRTTNERPIAFQPNSTTKVFIASDGNMNVYEKLAVGKTTAASTYPLEVDGAVLAQNFKAQMTASGNTYTGTVDQYFGSMQIRTDAGGTISLGGSGTGSVQNNVFIKDGDLDVNGDVTADFFIGDGSQLTNISTSDTLQDVTDNGNTTTNDIIVSGNIQSLSQIRAIGWYNTETGSAGDLAFEIGASNGEAYALAYDRNTTTYGDMNFAAVNFNFDERGGTTTIEGNEVWHAGNDGSGSGLDADTVDGLQASQFLRSDADDTATGMITINTTGGGILRLQNNDASNAQNQTLGSIVWNNQDPSGTGANNAAIIEAQAYDSIGQGANLLFKTVLATTEGGDATTSMTILANGNVGIGESNPLVPLHISRNSASGENIALILDNNDSTVNSEVGLLFRSYVGSTNTDFQIATINTAANQANLVFRSDGTVERMRITNTGNVGIGTTSPSGTLDVRPNASCNYVFTGTSTSGYTTTFNMDDTGLDIGHNSTSRSLNLKTGNSDRLTITGGGQVLIGQTSNSTSQALQVNGFIDQTATTAAFRLYNGSTFVGGIGNGQWAYSSSYLNDYAVYAVNDLYLSAGGTLPQFVLTSGQNVGIGTTTPLHKLQIVGDAQFGESATVSEDSRVRIRTSSDGFIGMVRTGVRTWAHKIDAGGHYYIRNADASYNTLTLTDTNRVGIGVTEPSGMLHVADQASTVTLMLGRASGTATIKSDGTADGHLILDSATNGTAVWLQNYTSGNVYLATGGGSVGIGTTSLSYKLDVAGTARIQSNAQINGDLTVLGSTNGVYVNSSGHASVRVDRGSTTYDNNLLFYTAGVLDFRIWQDGSSDYLYIRDETGGGGNMVTFKKGGNVGIGTTGNHFGERLRVQGWITAGSNGIVGLFGENGTDVVAGAYTNHAYILRTNNTERMRITSAGNVGIGTTAPTQTLDVGGSAHISSDIHLDRSSFITMYGNNNAYHGIGSRNAGGSADDDIRINSYGAVYINLDSNNNNTSSADFKIGRHGAASGTISSWLFNVDGETGAGTFSGDIIAFGSPSDISLKENIKPIEGALDKVKKLQGVTFDWKQNDDDILKIKEDYGFIAQEVQEVLPELVRENENGKLSLRDKGIISVLVEAVKEQQKQIDELKARLDGSTK